MILAGAATLLCTAPAALADHERPPRQRSADDVVLVGAIQGLGAGTAVNGLTIEARQFHYTATASGGFNGVGAFTVVVERDGAELVEHRSTTRACSPSGVIQPGDKIVIRAEPGAAVAAGSSYRCGAPA
jgi:hypothetical protein